MTGWARILAFFAGHALMTGALAHDPLWSSAERVAVSHRALSPAAVDAWRIDPGTDRITTGLRRLDLTLPGRRPTTARLDRVFRHGNGGLTWIGRVGENAGHVLLTRRGGWISGLVRIGEENWEIRPDADHGQLLLKIDPSGFPACGGAIEPRPDVGGPIPALDTPATGLQEPFGNVDPRGRGGSIIDVLVVYSAEARQQLGGSAQIEAHAQAAVDNGNLALSQSLADVFWNIVHIAEIDHSESGSCGNRLSELANSAEAADLRDQHGADLVGMLLADAGTGCGCGYVMRNPGSGFSESAFQVTANGCAVGNLTYAHEHGHNSGMEHDPENGASPGAASYPWSFGHFVDRDFRTVMSYSTQCEGGCQREAYFSNPDVEFNNDPTGIDDRRDNARTASLTAPVIAAFRTRPAQEPSLVIDPETIDLALLQGTNGSRILTLANSGAATLEWTIETDMVTWLNLDGNTGSIEAGESTAIALALDASSLQIGAHTARLFISSNDPQRPEMALPLTLRVVGPTILRDRFEPRP